MTETSKRVFDEFQVRKSKKQKTVFIDHIKSFAESNGYTFSIEKGSFGSRNIVIGNPETAKAVYTAHYDTCPRLPFPNFITPKNFGIYLFYQLLITVAAVAFVFFGAALLGIAFNLLAKLIPLGDRAATLFTLLSFWIPYLTVFGLLLAGPANKHTANDNTSGVITLIEIMQALPEDKRGDIAFIFFDLEEMGLFGSSSYAKAHKKAIKDKLILNFDCISDGNTILFAVKNSAKKYIPALEASFVSNSDYTVDIASKGVFYPSDQANFKGGVGVASLKYSEKLKTLYMDKIHTKHDIVFTEENIEFLCAGAVELTKHL